MSNYYHRDKEGNWFIISKGKLYPRKGSDILEIAFQMGKIDALREKKEELDAQKVKMLTRIA